MCVHCCFSYACVIADVLKASPLFTEAQATFACSNYTVACTSLSICPNNYNHSLNNYNKRVNDSKAPLISMVAIMYSIFGYIA